MNDEEEKESHLVPIAYFQRVNDALEHANGTIDEIVIYKLFIKLIKDNNLEKKFDLFTACYELTKIEDRLSNPPQNITTQELSVIHDHCNALKQHLKTLDLSDDNEIEEIKKEFAYLQCLLDLKIDYLEAAHELLDNLIECYSNIENRNI